MSAYLNILECIAGSNGTIFDPGNKGSVMEMMPEWIFSKENLSEYKPWIGAMIGSILVGLSGVLPLLVISIDQTHNLKHGASANYLKVLLSFAVGGLLGDVFLHSLPEIWANDIAQYGEPQLKTGLLLLAGLMSFVSAEKLFSVIEKFSESCSDASEQQSENNNVQGYNKEAAKHIKQKRKKIAGYLNLFSNTIDNFTHGLSLGGAFLVSQKLGVLTTFAILVHEIPHEVGDFAILLKSGFSRLDAAIFQILTAGGGLVGSAVAINFSGAANSIEARTSWIMPFTAGTFLHIALVTVLPDLLKEKDTGESLKQLGALIAGITLMAVVTTAFE